MDRCLPGIWICLFLHSTGNVRKQSLSQHTGSSGVLLTPAEIAKHNSAGSCWVIISGKVYDLTSYLGIHPGGPGQIIPSCGKDGTRAFATKNSGSSHSSYATSLLDAYFIGDSGAAVTVTPLPAGTPLPLRGGGDEND